jgi:uncharacterized protein (TIGR02246 family)
MRENANMPKNPAKLHAIIGGTPDEIEATFYDALQHGDLETLMACWADEDDIACIHPGGGRLVGMGAIRAAFDAMFTHGGAIHVRPENIRRVESLASAVHHVVEVVEILTPEGPSKAHVLATNVYHKTPQGWRLVVHHASPGVPHELDEHHRTKQVLH